ncbi:hypothetical protein HCN44_009780 [Aphidius gifuensis]|uniref:C2HC/C3H-type domain-containing protein n=1 Tax=Aphidius gifuensis TaxID=684658 RepID=A0A834Y5S1_APHGI|nr:hypothetical protein HCN44_009780 [Aphidius gifuensis]
MHEPAALLPCSICGRTFKLQSLEKHTIICEKTVTKKRKPFDSSKQRIRGTCPTCNRQFGIKAYDRHVAWCKDRVTHVPSNAMTNVAKERLDARMKYRAPVLKNRRMTNREKYAPSSSTTTTTTTTTTTIMNNNNNNNNNKNLSSPGSIKPKESISLPNSCKIISSSSSNSYKPAVVRKISQGKNEGIVPSGPLKSRPSDRSFIRNSATTCRPAWSNYVRRHPDFNLVLKGRTGMTQDYDPFLLAERQMNDLLSDTCSDDQSFPEFTNSQNTNTNNDNNNINSNSNLSAFVKYPNQITLNSNDIDKRTSSIAQLPPSPPSPPTQPTTTNFDELSTGFSSDSTETNSISREILNDFELTRHKTMINNNNNNNNNLPILGRKMIIDKSKALGKIIIDNNSNDTIDIINLTKNNLIIDRNNKSAKLSRSHVNRSNSVRASSAPKIPERNNSIVSSVNKASSRSISSSSSSSSSLSLSTSDFNKNNKNNYLNNLNGSNLSLSSIVSSDVVGGVGSIGNVGNVKRSNSLFEDLVCSFEDNVSGSYSSLRSFLKTDSLSSSSPVQSSIRPRNGQISDEDLSSPDSYNKKEHGKISLDSAYSSLNRKNYNCKLDEKNIKVGQHQEQDDIMSKMSKFCHQCGTKFPETAKFCCECGIRRLAI